MIKIPKRFEALYSARDLREIEEHIDKNLMLNLKLVKIGNGYEVHRGGWGGPWKDENYRLYFDGWKFVFGRYV